MRTTLEEPPSADWAPILASSVACCSPLSGHRKCLNLGSGLSRGGSHLPIYITAVGYRRASVILTQSRRKSSRSFLLILLRCCLLDGVTQPPTRRLKGNRGGCSAPSGCVSLHVSPFSALEVDWGLFSFNHPFLSSQCHLGTKNYDKQMTPYIYKRRADGKLSWIKKTVGMGGP
jgi:hypothetical protein